MLFTQNPKANISAPLGAGSCVADGHHLPGPVNDALEYASKQLRKKGSWVTLLAVRRDYQLPASPLTAPEFESDLPPASFLRQLRKTTSTPKAGPFKRLVRLTQTDDEGGREKISYPRRVAFRGDDIGPSPALGGHQPTLPSPLGAEHSHGSELPAVGKGIPLTPSTPFAVVSSFSGTAPNSDVAKLEPQNTAQFGAMLAFAEQLGPRDEKDVLQAFDKARRKFSLAYVQPLDDLITDYQFLTRQQSLLAPRPHPALSA